MSDLEYAPRGTDSVRLVGVHASDSLGLRGGAIGRLRGVDWTFGPGIHAVVGTVADGTAALASVLTGELRPEVGSCLVDGVSPFDSPASRRRIGALLPKPTPLAGSVEELALFCAGRAGWQALLERFDLGALASRQLATLALRDARAVELALAFGTVSPRLLVLFEPWSDVRGIDVMEFRELLLEHAATVPVVLLTSSLACVAPLTEHVLFLAGGRFAALDGTVGWLARASQKLNVTIDCRSGLAVRELAHALSTRLPLARGVSWEHVDGEAPFGVVSVVADDLEAVALTVAQVCQELAVEVRSIATPPLDREALLSQVLRARLDGASESEGAYASTLRPR